MDDGEDVDGYIAWELDIARHRRGTDLLGRARLGLVGFFGWPWWWCRSCDHAACVPAVLLVHDSGSLRFSSSQSARRSSCTQSVQGLMVDVPVNRSDKFQQFTFVVRALCRKPSSFHRCSSWALFRHTAGSTGYMFCVSPVCF